MDTGNSQITTSVASVATRAITKTTDVSAQVLSTVGIPEEWRIDAKPFVNRPFFVANVEWNQTSPQFTVLPCSIKCLPGDIIRSNKALVNAMKMAAYYRPKGFLSVTLAGTITHSGCILAGIIPPTTAPLNTTTPSQVIINTLLSGPHAFLNANEATSVQLNMPWFCNTDLASLDLETSSTSAVDLSSYVFGNYGTLVLYVLNPLQPSTGSSTSLSIVIDAVFENLDIVIPTTRYVDFVSESDLLNVGSSLVDSGFQYAKKLAGDALDSLRGVTKEFTGLHNPNLATINNRVINTNANFVNAVDTLQYFEKLDPYAHRDRVVMEPIFNTSIDEMQLKHILSKPQYIGTFSVNEKDPVGKLLFSGPISPYQGGLSSSEISIANNIELLYWLSRAWTGDIEISIQAVMNNKQQVKLRLFNMYNVSRNVTTGYPLYQDIVNSPSHLMEFTAGGQVHKTTLPYLCRTEQLYCSRDTSFAALMHGMYYVYIGQSLANSSDSPMTVSFNVFISAPKVTLFGYSTDNPLKKFPSVIVNTFKSESLNVMNTPADQSAITSSVCENEPDEIQSRGRLQPIYHCRDYARRMYYNGLLNAYQPSLDIDPYSTKTTYLSLPYHQGDLYNPDVLSTPSIMISNMFYGKSAGLKFRLVPLFQTDQLDSSPLLIKVVYVPPDQYMDVSTGLISKSAVSLNEIDSIATTFIERDTFPIEFTIPNMNPYKYIGSASKMTDTQDTIGLADNGNLIIIAYNKSPIPIKGLTFKIYCGFTDETRFGFHCIAPNYVFSSEGKIASAYQQPATNFPSARNKYIYYRSS